jgi:F-type H+-transporting ATPase subunit gamma
MPSTRDIRRRIKSVTNTAQITKAMEMVASSKMRKAQQMALAGRPYGRLMVKVVEAATHHAGDFSHPLMEVRLVRKRAVIVVSTDKGLCGALNGNLLREAVKFDKDTTVYITAGKKAAQFVARTRRQLAADFTYHDTPQFTEARAISKFAQEMFLKGGVDHVDVLFTRFINTLSQRPITLPFLPVGELKLDEMRAKAGGQAPDDGHAEQSHAPDAEFLFEPGADQVFGALIPHYLNFIAYQVLLEAKASEQSARMVAMKSATDNAHQLIADMTLEYNKLRQSNITKELLEISTAQMALGN